MYYLYIIESIECGRWYIGISENPERRLREHNSGKTRSTKPYQPYRLVYSEEYKTKTEARKRELQIKKSGIIR
ncbi:GIY-YIG nuclease family protein [Patescibacteria group bacterium]|nr:GIY-YIG nuclease family protein [Patescibacteria group bacterium]